MEISYIILAHKNPHQLNRLIASLNSESAYFYIHIDKNVDSAPFLDLFKEQKNIYILINNKREPGIWGDVGIVKGTLNCLKKIIDDGRKGYTFLLSGQDYPLRSKEKILEFLKDNDGAHFIDIYPLPNNLWGDTGGMERIKKYKINYSSKRYNFFLVPSIYDSSFYTRKNFNRIKFLLLRGKKKELLKVFKKRIIPGFIKPYGGTQWWALPNETLQQIYGLHQRYPEFLKFHEDTLLPDEIFFQSLLMNLPNSPSLKISPSLTYANWDPKRAPLPVTFQKKDFQELEQASKKFLFARKFDIKMDSEIIDKLHFMARNIL